MFELPLKIRLYLSTLENLISKVHQNANNKQQVVDPYLLRAFNNQK